MIRYGIVRNGEHIKLFSSKEEAEAQVKQSKADDVQAEKDGWIKSASDTRYYIQEVKRLPW